MKKLIGFLLLISLTTVYAQVSPAGKDTSSGAGMDKPSAGSSKSETGSMGTTGSQGTTTEAPLEETCTSKKGKELKATDKGYSACVKAHRKK